MNIVIVDGYTLNPGDLSWEPLRKLASCDIYDRSSYEENIQRCQDADIVLTNKVVFDKQTFTALPRLKMISVTATGYNIIDLESSRQHNVTVCNVPTYGTTSVAQMVMAHLLELCHHVSYHSATVNEGKWCRSDNFCYWDRPLIELQGLTLGIIGLGKIGLAVAQLGRAFGMRVIGYDVQRPKNARDIEFKDIDAVFSQSDVISMHCPLTPQTEGMINAASISKMKKTVLFINTSRGPLVNENDLAEALNSGRIAGAGLDVLSSEPPREDNPLLKAKNCYITPHIAWATKSARQRLLDITIDNVASFIKGAPVNVVNK